MSPTTRPMGRNCALTNERSLSASVVFDGDDDDDDGDDDAAHMLSLNFLRQPARPPPPLMRLSCKLWLLFVHVVRTLPALVVWFAPNGT